MSFAGGYNKKNIFLDLIEFELNSVRQLRTEWPRCFSPRRLFISLYSIRSLLKDICQAFLRQKKLLQIFNHSKFDVPQNGKISISLQLKLLRSTTLMKMCH